MRARPLRARVLGDAGFAVALAVLAALELREAAASSPATGLLIVGATLPLAARRTAPLAALVAVLAAWVLHVVVAGAPPLSLALALAFVLGVGSAAAHAPPRRALVGLALALMSGGVLSASTDSSGINDVLAANLFSVVVPWLLGAALARQRTTRALRARTEALEREQEERARAAVAAERARLARELHDVVAHAASIIVVQAEAGEAVLQAGRVQDAEEAFRTIQRAGREALGELRRLLGLLRSDEDEDRLAPQPRLSDLDALVARCRTAGVDAAVHVHGAPAHLAPGLELSAYRILQEALTNVVRHVGPARAQVVVRYGEEDLDLEVVDEGPLRDRPAVGAATRGHGLVGMRERARLYGGTLEAGPRPGGGYRLRARLPRVEP